MQQNRGEDPDVACHESERMMKFAADRHNRRLTSNAKVFDLSPHVNMLKVSMSNSDHNVKIKEQRVKEVSDGKSSEAIGSEVLSRCEKRIRELEEEVERGKGMKDLFVAQTEQLEYTKTLLEESNLEIFSLHEKLKILERLLRDIEKSSLRGCESSRVETPLKHPADEVELIKDELRQAVEAEENSKKAMDDLVLALHEVTTEANRTKEMLKHTQMELEDTKRESRNLKDKLKAIKDEFTSRLDEARKEVRCYKNTAKRLRMEADESLRAFTSKEMSFVECIKKVEDERAAALEENVKLIQLLAAAEDRNLSAKEENHKLRDILKQALNEANVAKEAAIIARAENSQLKDEIAEKDNALNFVTQENENLKINEVEAFKNIKDLKQMISAASSKELKAEEKQDERGLEQQNAVNRKKLSNTFSLSVKDHVKHNNAVNKNHQRTPDFTNYINEIEFRQVTDPQVA